MLSIPVQELLEKHSVPDSETSYLGKARMVHFHVEGSSGEFQIPRYHYNFITGINVLGNDKIKGIKIKLGDRFEQSCSIQKMLNMEDIKEYKMENLLKVKNLLQGPLYLSENITFMISFRVSSDPGPIAVLIEYGTIVVPELVKISHSEYIMETTFNDKLIHFEKGFVK